MRLVPNLLFLLPPLVAQSQFTELQRRALPDTMPSASVLATIDLGNDGAVDLLVANYTGGAAVWSNLGLGQFAPVSAGALAANVITSAFAIGDLDGDGRQDVVQATVSSGLRLLRGGPSSLTQFPTSSLPPTAQTVQAVSLFDADGDGDLDLIYGEGGGSGTGNRLLLNNGAAVFTDVTWPWLGGAASGPGSNQFVPFDCDGDGDRDLLSIRWNGAPRLFRNQGGSFAQVAFPATAAWCATSGDVDGDGDADVVLGNQSSDPWLRQDRLLRNNGSGVFTDVTATTMPALANWTSVLHLVDVDGDGDRDLVVTHSTPMLAGYRLGHALLQNDGTGVFSDASAALPNNDLASESSVVFDGDGDGDPEYVFASQLGPRLYWNDNAHYVDSAGPALPPRFSTTESLAAGDLDNDGQVDLFAGGLAFSALGGQYLSAVERRHRSLHGAGDQPGLAVRHLLRR